LLILGIVAETQIVRARKRQGSNSLDITIPARVTRTHEIKHGDVFEVDALLDRGEVKLVYKRVYKKR
jgi:hypothetical protein